MDVGFSLILKKHLKQWIILSYLGNWNIMALEGLHLIGLLPTSQYGCCIFSTDGIFRTLKDPV